jgi:ankyrin repeat protein
MGAGALQGVNDEDVSAQPIPLLPRAFIGRNFLSRGQYIPSETLEPLVVIARKRERPPVSTGWWRRSFKRKPERQVSDPGATSASAEELLGRGLRADYLLDMTCELNLWHWKMSEVVEFLVKPATEAHRRCRFSDLPFVQPFTGNATLYISSCFGGSWGDIVVGACAGGPTDRYVYIEVLAKRFRSSAASIFDSEDADLRAVMSGCKAVVFGVPYRAPAVSDWMLELTSKTDASPDSAVEGHSISWHKTAKPEWCLPLQLALELFTASDLGLDVVFKCGAVQARNGGSSARFIVDEIRASKVLRGFIPKVHVAAAMGEFSSFSSSPIRKEAIRALKKPKMVDRKIVQLLKVSAATFMQPAVSDYHELICCGKPWMFKKKVPANLAVSLFRVACAAGNVTFVKELYFDYKEVLGPGEDMDYLPLYLSASAGQEAVAAFLLDEIAVDPNKASQFQVTPLFKASTNGHLAVVQFLLSRGAQADTPKNNGVTALFMASQNGHADVVQELIQAGSLVSSTRRSDGAFPLSVASQHGHENVARVLIQHGADVETKTLDGTSSLFVAASRGHIGVFRHLLDHGAEAKSLPALNGSTPLLGAAQHGHDDIVKLLLDLGADADQARKVDFKTPLVLATEAGHMAVVATLLKGGADVNKAQQNGMTPLFIATLLGHIPLVQLLLRNKALVDKAKIGGVTPIMVRILDVLDVPNDRYHKCFFLIGRSKTELRRNCPALPGLWCWS